MRTLIHLSDLHFGRIDPAILDPLVKFIGRVKPDLVAVSGDFTQRARIREFVEAGLVDHLHVVVVPIVLGRGTRLWDGLEALEEAFGLSSYAGGNGTTA